MRFTIPATTSYEKQSLNAAPSTARVATLNTLIEPVPDAGQYLMHDAMPVCFAAAARRSLLSINICVSFIHSTRRIRRK